jgi:hypothetical protein
MASTYTVNLGIEKIGTGEQSGTWGDTTNTNFDLIDQAVNGAVAVTLASAGTSGSPNTLAITDGAASDGRNKFIDFNDGGDLGATAYVQLTPNDAEKLVHIRNSLSGGRSLIIFQGTYNASNDFEIPNGKDVVLKFDGGGASATVTQVFEDLLVTAVAATTVDTTNIEVTNLKAKDGTAAGSIADSTGVVTIASSVLTTTDINGGSVDGVTLGTNSAVTEAQIDNININGNTISSTDTDGNVTITPDGTGSVAITKIDVAGGEIDGTAIGANSASTGAFTTLNATGGGALTGTWTDLGSVTTVDINGGTIDGVTIGGSSAGAITGTTGQFNTSLNVDGTVTADGADLDGAVVINESGADVDFRIESDTNANAFFLEGGLGFVGIGEGSPLRPLHVNAGTTDGVALFESGDAVATIWVADGNSTNTSQVGLSAVTNDLLLYSGGSERLRIDSTGNVGIGTSSPATELEVVGTGDVNGAVLIVDDAGSLGVEIQSTSPTIFFNEDDTTDQNYQIRLSSGALNFQTQNDSRNAAATKMTLDASGNVGIGTSSPASKLHVLSTSAESVRIAYDATKTARLGATSAGDLQVFAFDGSSYRNILLAVDSTTSAGNVGIGTSSPSYKLHVLSSSDPAFFDSTGTNKKVYIQETSDGNSNTGLSIRKKHSTLHPAGYWYGDIRFQGWDGSAYRSAGLIECVAEGTPSASNMPGNLRFSTNGGAADPSERMRITSAGNVGIGTSSPAEKLEVFGTTGMRANAGGYLLKFLNSSSTSELSGFIYDNNQDNIEFTAYDSSYALTFKTANTERMRIDTSGNVGLGSNAISSYTNYKTLTIDHDTTGSILQLNGATSGHYHLVQNNNGSMIISADQGNAVGSTTINFLTDGTERARIDSSGNLLVGKTVTGQVLTNGIELKPGNASYISACGDQAANPPLYLANKAASGTRNLAYFYGTSTLVGSITHNGTNTAYNTSSDARLKENIADAEDAGAKVDAIQVRQFDWKEGGAHQDYGMIAQELMNVAPEAVSGDPESDEMMGVDYSKLVPMMLKEIQSLRARVHALEGK